MATLKKIDDTGLTLYAILRDAALQLWYTTVMEAWNAAHYADYAIAATEQGSTGFYSITSPATLPVGVYSIDWRSRQTGTPAQSDPCVGLLSAYWDGINWFPDWAIKLAQSAAPITDSPEKNVKDILADTNELQADWANGGRLDTILDTTNAVATWQRHAKLANDCVGTVWYVATAANGGNDSSDGLTPWTPKLSPKTTIEAASAGDLVLIGPGTFALGNAVILTPNGVFVYGVGEDATIITSTATYTTGAIVRPPSNGKLMDFTIEGLNTNGTYQYPLGISGTTPVGYAFTNSIAERLHLIADTDGLYVNCLTACSVLLRNCRIETNWDCVISSNGGHLITLEDCRLGSTGPSSVAGSQKTSAVGGTNGTILVYNSKLHTGNAEDTAYGVDIGTSCVVTLFNCEICTSGTAYSVNCGVGASITLISCTYDRTATTGGGQIIDIPAHSLDSNGLTIQAAVDLALDAYNTTGVAKEASVGAIATVLSGITSLAAWLRGLYRKDAMNATAKSEVNNGGGGTFDEATDSLEAIRDTAPMGSVMRGTDNAYTGTPPTVGQIDTQLALTHGDGQWDATAAGLSAQEVRDAMKLAPTAGDPAEGSVDKELDDVVNQATNAAADAATAKIQTTATAIRADLGLATANLDTQLAPLSVIPPDTPIVIIPDSDPGFITGYFYCYLGSVLETGVVIEIQGMSATGTGHAASGAIVSATSDSTGLVSFTGLLPGAVYRIRRSLGTWKQVAIPIDATSPRLLSDIFG